MSCEEKKRFPSNKKPENTNKCTPKNPTKPATGRPGENTAERFGNKPNRTEKYWICFGSFRCPSFLPPGLERTKAYFSLHVCWKETWNLRGEKKESPASSGPRTCGRDGRPSRLTETNPERNRKETLDFGFFQRFLSRAYTGPSVVGFRCEPPPSFSARKPRLNSSTGKMSNFFRGTNLEQDIRYKDKMKKLRKTMRFPACYKEKVVGDLRE